MGAFYVVSIAAVAALISCAISILIVQSQHWHGKHSLDHDLDGVQKFHVTAVPRIGGLAVVTGVLLAPTLCLKFFPGLPHAEHVASVMKLLAASLPAVAAGLVEDLTKRVSVKLRLTAAIASALAASFLLGATVDQLDIYGVDDLLVLAPVAIAVTAVVVAGGVNAINIIDGFNGLAASVVIIMSAAFGVLAWQAGDELVLTLALLGAGTTLGFLLVNYPTGRLFLGDGGAYFLGFWVAEIAVLLLVRNPSVNAWQVLSICAYPVIEVLYSMYRRKIVRKSSPGSPDALHLHTLVYRRLVFRVFRGDPQFPWKRNAAVACVIAPSIVLTTFIGVVAGRTIVAAFFIVIAQVLLYVTAYARLVRGRWRRHSAASLAVGDDVNAELT